MGNRIVFKSNINIGQNGAENDDEFLFKCFVDHEALQELKSISKPAMFVVGSTGSGKTALLKMLAKNEKNTSELDVHNMAMSYVASNDVVQFLRSLEVDLGIFFQTLWRQVICIEYIKLVTKSEDEDRFRFQISKVYNRIKNASARKKLERFVEENQTKFWNTIDENIVEISDAFTSNVNAELGSELEKFNSRAGYSRGLSKDRKIQLQQRAKKFVDPQLVAELGHVVTALSEYTRVTQENYFILIDRLDENWVEESLKYELIQALFEALKSLQKLRNFKVVAALRNDVFERMVRESDTSKAQLEKYNDFIVRLRWSKAQLLSLANRRINHLFKYQYSSENVYFEDIFKQGVDGRISNWAYMLDRSMMRPRDIINFVNFTLQAAEGKSSVSKSDFLRGEESYSQVRYETLVYEWQSTFFGISVLLDILKSKPPFFEAANIMTSDLIEYIYDKMGADAKLQKDDIWIEVNNDVRGGGVLEPDFLAARVLQRLHLIGAVGLKTDASSPWNYYFETNRIVPSHAIDRSSKVKVHPMLHRALGNVERRKSS